jgi:hypothetical protein
MVNEKASELPVQNPTKYELVPLKALAEHIALPDGAEVVGLFNVQSC